MRGQQQVCVTGGTHICLAFFPAEFVTPEGSQEIEPQKQHLLSGTGPQGNALVTPRTNCAVPPPGLTVLQPSSPPFPSGQFSAFKPSFYRECNSSSQGARGPQCSGEENGDLEKYLILCLTLALLTQSSGGRAEDRALLTISPKYFHHDKPGRAQEPALRTSDGEGRWGGGSWCQTTRLLPDLH